MTFDAFELAVIDLASRGVRVTVVNVAAHTRMPPSQVEPMLDRMASEGRLDVELDEDRGLIFYVVRGLTPPPQTLALRPIDYPPPPAPVVSRGDKSVALGALFGLVFPGVGLLYAAPWTAAIVASIGIFAIVQMLGALPLIGWLLSSVALGLGALVSAVLGVRYVRRYNQAGRRTHLDLESTRSLGRTLATPLREAQRVALS